MKAETSTPAWQQQRERGAATALKLMLAIARTLGRRVTRLLLYPITGYFLLFGGAATRASRDFLTRALGRPPTLAERARHVFRFAGIVLDRLFFMMGRTQGIALKIQRDPEEERVTYGGEVGSLIFLSHLGSFEALRVAGTRRRPMKVLLDAEHGAVLTALLGSLDPEIAANIVDASHGGPGLVLTIKQELEGKHRLGMMVDRARAGEPTVRVPFLGGTAAFPTGPWQLAAALRARIVLAFCLYEGGNRYEGHFEIFSEALTLPRANREQALAECIGRYAQRLEHYARQSPFNWFNFYDFWAGVDEKIVRSPALAPGASHATPPR